jgi:hypothetical protein
VSGVILATAYAAFPGFWPPMSPSMSADEVAAFYRDNTAWIRFTMVTFNLCGIILLPLYAVVVVQMKRMARRDGLISFWVRNIAYGIYIIVMLVALRRAVHRQAIDEGLTR